MRWRAAVVVGAVLLGLCGLAGCGGSSHGATGSAAPFQVISARSLAVNFSPQAVSCVSATFCMAIVGFNDASDPTDADNGAVGAYEWNGTTWSSPIVAIPASVQAGNHEVEPSVSCTSPTRCVLVANNDASSRFPTYTWDGRSWTAGTTLDDPGTVPVSTYVTCSGPSFCLAFDGQTTWIDQGGTWNKVAVNADSFGCTSATFCLATVGSELPTERWDGSSWQMDGDGPPLDPQVMACARPALCVVAGRTGSSDQGRYVSAWNGSSWSKADSIVPSSGGDLTEASCAPGTSTCYVLDESAELFRYQDGTWTHQQTSLGASLTDLSCPTTTLCTVTDGIGGLIAFRP